MAERWRLLDYGPAALLVEVDASSDVDLVRAALVDLPDLGELVPAERTVLVVAASGLLDTAEVERRLAGAALAVDGPGSPEPGSAVEVEVTYDGADLHQVAAAVGLSVEEVVARHTAPTYRVGFCGFAPGFAYLVGLDPALELPRRDTPRTRVPTGSVAIAASYSAIYPRESPGGWHLLGRTDAVVWDLSRERPALLEPGAHVRFREARP